MQKLSSKQHSNWFYVLTPSNGQAIATNMQNASKSSYLPNHAHSRKLVLDLRCAEATCFYIVMHTKIFDFFSNSNTKKLDVKNAIL